jgi:hypothetical protein
MSNLLCMDVEASSGPEPEPGPLKPHHSSRLGILSYYAVHIFHLQCF